MPMIQRLFWDRHQHRIPMFWRLILQMVLFILFSTLLPMIAMTGMNAVSGKQTELISDVGIGYSTPETMAILNLTMLAGTLLSVWLAGRFLDRRRFTDFGLRINRAWWTDLGFGLLLGAFLMAVIFVIEWFAGWITITGTLAEPSGNPQLFWQGIVLSCLYFVAVGIQEELFSRGYQTKNLAEGLNGLIGRRGAIILAAILSSALFGYLHATNPNATLMSTFNICLAGIFLALGFLLTGELAIPIGIHITWNFFQGRVFGFPVSGMPSDTTFIAIRQGGNDLITGGAFGPEAGLIGIGAMALGCVLIVLWVQRRYKRVALHRQLVVPDLRTRNR